MIIKELWQDLAGKWRVSVENGSELINFKFQFKPTRKQIEQTFNNRLELLEAEADVLAVKRIRAEDIIARIRHKLPEDKIELITRELAK